VIKLSKEIRKQLRAILEDFMKKNNLKYEAFEELVYAILEQIEYAVSEEEEEEEAELEEETF